jgi:hypothetical protein
MPVVLASFIGSIAAFIAASLFLWKRPMGEKGLFFAWALFFLTMVEIGQAIILWVNQ